MKNHLSHVTVKTSLTEFTEIGALKPCLRPRTTEIMALREERTFLYPLEQQVLHLDRVAACPRCYPNEREAPRQPLFGLARSRWIGKRAGMTADAVERLLVKISRVMEASAFS